MLRLARSLLWWLLCLAYAPAFAGAQTYEPLASDVRAGLASAVADRAAPRHGFSDSIEAVNWLSEMSGRLQRRMPEFRGRVDFLRTVHYEAVRAGLDPQLVLAVINVESNFRKYAVSGAGARGFMQVMPFWTDLIGKPGDNLFSLRTNLRYGCVILKHYLAVEKGNVERALARYNGSLGKPEYPRMVFTTLQTLWRYGSTSVGTQPTKQQPPARPTQAGKIDEIVS
jgi:soluble lytic murein transglycosylase-like protein